MEKEYVINKARRFCGYIVGFVFYISGVLKLLDPVGAGLVMDEYFSFLHLAFLSFSSKTAGTLLALAESLIGAALITGVWRRITSRAAIIFQGFFTFMTLLLVIFNPEMDCGCFGEAIHLTHMETFLKNIVLCILLCAYFFPMKMLGQPQKRKYVSFGIVTVSVTAFMIYSWMYIPLMNFTDYKPAAALKAGQTSSDSDGDMFEAVFVYEKDGNEQTFDLNHLPDSTWNFVRTETAAVSEQESDGLIDLSFYNESGEYLDELAVDGKVMVVSVYDPSMKAGKWEKINGFVRNAEEAGFRTLILVSGEIPEQMAGQDNIYHADYKTLLSLNRSNGGATYFSRGYLVRKWAERALPSPEELEEIYGEDETETIIYHDTKGSLGFQGFLLYVFAVMLLL